MESKENEKKLAGERAADFVKDGMIVGLGTGTTVAYTIKKLGVLVKEGLKIEAVSTSGLTTQLAESLGIKVSSIDEVPEIDITIDGADETDENFNGIKGGGGALLYEKIVASASKEIIWVVDSEKMVRRIGKFPLPVEVVPFGMKHTFELLKKRGYNPTVRMTNNKIFITDGGHNIIDLHLEQINNPEKLECGLNLIPGVVECGLFLGMVDKVIVGKENSVEILKAKQ